VVRCENKISNPETGKCISCEDKHFANTDTNNCTECPRLFEGSSALAPGVECSGGSISFKDDIFVVPDGSTIGPHTTTLRCRDPGACTTMVELKNFTALTVCQGSTTGALCGACEDGYAKGAPGSPCVQCAADSGVAPVLLLLAALLLFGILYRQCIKFALQNARKGHKSKFMTFSLLKIGMAYVCLGLRVAIAAGAFLIHSALLAHQPQSQPQPQPQPQIPLQDVAARALQPRLGHPLGPHLPSQRRRGQRRRDLSGVGRVLRPRPAREDEDDVRGAVPGDAAAAADAAHVPC
jgi:hypothetical protein